MSLPDPPRWADRFLKWYCNPDYLEEIQGDIYELFDRRCEDKGNSNAKIRFVWDVFRFFRWSNIKRKNSKYSTMKGTLLFRNYLKLGFRNIQKNLVISSINIVGLSLAIGFAISIFVFTDMMLSMDRFHTKGDRIYQITSSIEQENQNLLWGSSPLFLGPQLLEDHPSVESITRIERKFAAVKKGTEVFDEEILFVDPSYLEIFDLPILYGNRQVLYGKQEIVISRDMAVKYFKNEDPVGKEVSMKFYDGKIKKFIVGTVLEKFPYNSGLRPSFLIPMDNYFELAFKDHHSWSDFADATFVMMKEGERIESIQESFDTYISLQNNSDPEWTINKFVPIELYELSKNAYRMRYVTIGGGHPAGRTTLIIISCFLLGMACFNFMNISVVSATKRLKEIALRKVMGSRRKEVISQFLVENTLQCIFALILGGMLSYFLITPWFDLMIPEMELRFRTHEPITMVTFFVGLLLVVGLVSGAYPALYISRFDPITIFKGNQKFGSRNVFSRILLGVQFFLAILTIVGCFVFVDESLHLAKKDWGYDPKGVISVWVDGKDQYDRLRNEVMNHQAASTFSGASHQIGRNIPLTLLSYGSEEIPIRAYGVADDYLETFQLRLKEGRFLDNNSDQEGAVVVNEKFVDALGWNDAINQTFVLDSVRRTVVGVVEDFHYFGLYNPIDPLIIHGLKEENYRYLSIQSSSNGMFDLDSHLKKSWHMIAPNDTYDRIFQEDVFDEFYHENRSNVMLILFISIIAIVLACMGLYGLISFNVQAKMKELGVRKVLGAPAKAIITITSRQYLWILLIAFILGAPLGFLGMSQLVNTIFPDPKGLSFIPFIIAMLLIFGTMTFTILGQLLRAIKVNPAEILRDE